MLKTICNRQGIKKQFKTNKTNRLTYRNNGDVDNILEKHKFYANDDN